MSIVPLTNSGDVPSVVTSADQFDMDGRAVLIQPFDDTHPKGTSNASYDLRVGSRYLDHRDTEPRTLPEGGKISISPGMAIIIETIEHVHFPKTLFGQIVPRVKWLQQGLANTPTKVDPGYRGPLAVTVFNHGARTVHLKRNEAFCSLFVTDVDTGGLRPYDKGGKSLEGLGMGFWRRAYERIVVEHAPLVAVISMLAAVASAVLAVIAIWSR